MRKILLILVVVLSAIVVYGYYYKPTSAPAEMFFVYDDNGVRKTAQLNISDMRKVCPECGDGFAIISLNDTWSIDTNGSVVGLTFKPATVINGTIWRKNLSDDELAISYSPLGCHAVFAGGYDPTFSFFIQDKNGVCYFGYEFPKIPSLPELEKQ